MSAQAVPFDRTAHLQTYALAPTSREPELDSVVAEAARVCGAPVAMLGFLFADRELVKASFGWNVRELPLASSFAARLAEDRDVVVISDATSEARFRAHPLVAGAPNVRFFAGAPLVDSAGCYLGALMVLDRATRMLQPQQAEMLRVLARHVVRELELRRDLAASRELLEESDARFRDFFEQTDDLVMSIAADGRLLHTNEATLAALGLTRDELSQSPILRLVDPDEREPFRRAWAAVFQTGEPQRIETVFITGGGRRITVEGALRPRVIDGRAVMVRVVFRDVTDRKQFEAELGTARDAALEAARLKTQFLTNVSHEIRTPMNGIIGMIDLLLGTALNPEQVDFAHQARASAEQLLSIVNNILYVSNVEAGRLTSSNVDFDLYRTLERIVEVMRVSALGKELEISLTIDDQVPPIVRGNQARVRQIVTNLLENAVKFTEQGSVSLRAFVQTETESHRVVRFEVRDTGIGISAEDRLLLFERFSQVEASSSRRFQGVGLGLATARHLIETMGGLMDVESTPGFGSTFWFTVPFAKTTGMLKPIASSDLEFRGKRVLLVDQLPTNRRIVRHYLEVTWEMQVDVAQTAAEAFAALEREAYRVVLFDTMPDMDPIAFAKAVRGNAATAAVSLVHLFMGAAKNEEELRAAGVASLVAKPVGQGDLFDALTIAMAHDAIPLARSAMEQRATSGAAAPRVLTAEMRGSIRVLLAEDNFLNRKLTLSQLEKLGYVADSVANGAEAVQAIEREKYDVVLMDCQMPVVDGYEATMEIRKREKSGSVARHRIIAMTANALEGDREKCLAAGMDDYLAKPTKHDDLDAALGRYFV
jgi:two-component system sensor histidine kinase/response regulator